MSSLDDGEVNEAPLSGVMMTPLLTKIMEELLLSEALSDTVCSILSREDVATLNRSLRTGTASSQSFKILVEHGVVKDSEGGMKEILKGSKLCFPAFQESKDQEEGPSKELIERREYLKLKQQAREYNKMVHGGDGSDPNVKKELELGNQLSATRNHASVISNVIVATLASFAIAYFAGQQTGASDTTCLVSGLIGAIVVLVIEMTLYVVRAIQMEKQYENPSTSFQQKLQQRSGGISTIVPEKSKKSSKSQAMKETSPIPEEEIVSVDLGIKKTN